MTIFWKSLESRHDFRPEYRRIRPIINEIGTAPLIALTATATPKVQMDWG